MKARWSSIALAASLAGNLFLGGLILGSALREGQPGEGAPPQPAGRLAAVSERLDPEEAEALRSLLRERSDAAEPRLAALRAARREVDAIMAEPTYRPDAVRTALERARTEEAALRGEVDEALIQFAEGLDPEERAALAPLLRKGRRLQSDHRPERGRP